MKSRIVHIAQIEINEESGMGRVAWHWKREFERRGYEFLHIGNEQVGSLPHQSLFPYAARRVYRRLNRPASVLLVHEPSSGVFIHGPSPTVVFSHGIERRAWQLSLNGKSGAGTKPRLRTKILFPFWRLRQGDKGLREATKLMLINGEDVRFAIEHYNRDPGEIFFFKNGVYSSSLDEKIQPDTNKILFLGSWLDRKGCQTLIEAAQVLAAKGLVLNWLLAGTGLDRDHILAFWPKDLRPFVEVIPKFSKSTEETLFAQATLFVLPSYFEGQPLALLQAMEAGRCCITTNCCGQLDLIKHGVNGLLHKPGDAQQLASLIEMCLGNYKLRVLLGKNAKHSVQGRDWESVSSEVVDFAEGIM
jgi:glycosyltransferase involved in cell wall biosynthesis